MTSTDIQKILIVRYLNSNKYVCSNAFFGSIEMDFCLITQSRYFTEFEIKISRSDFFADKKKEEKHLLYSGKKDKGFIPNRFYYVCPKGLIDKSEVPTYAGLLYVDGNYISSVEKLAPMLHKNQTPDWVYLTLMDKYYFRYIQKMQKIGGYGKKITKLLK